MKYKLLALDMDGTLLNSEKKISPKTAKAISELSKTGVHVVLSTGRGLTEVSDYKNELKFMHYGILVSGGLIYDFKNSKAVVSHPLTEDLLMKLIDAALEEKVMIHILSIDKSMMNFDDIAHIEDFHMEIYKDMYERITVDCKDFKKYVHENPGKVIKFNMYHRSRESRERNLAKFKNEPLTFSYAEETALEASPKGITKASGLLELCDFLKIDTAETVAVGDAPNDLEILQTAGIAAVMGNASDEIKKFADFITDDNDNDGVIKVIEKFF